MTAAMDGGPVRLAIEAQRTVLNSGAPDSGVASLDVGWQTLAQRFRHDVPTAAEIEQAIDLIEDEVGRVARDVRGPALLANDPVIARIVRTANPGAADTATAGVDAVEHLFTRLAARASGSLAASDALPEERRFAATLLILRELMHHLGFASVTALVA